MIAPFIAWEPEPLAHLIAVCQETIEECAQIIDHAEDYPSEFVCLAIIAIRNAQERLRKYQSPNFGPN